MKMTEFEFVYKELSRLSKNITLIKKELKEFKKEIKKIGNCNEILMNQYDIKFIIDGKDHKLMSAIVELIKKTEGVRLPGGERNG